MRETVTTLIMQGNPDLSLMTISLSVVKLQMLCDSISNTIGCISLGYYYDPSIFNLKLQLMGRDIPGVLSSVSYLNPGLNFDPSTLEPGHISRNPNDTLDKLNCLKC